MVKFVLENDFFLCKTKAGNQGDLVKHFILTHIVHQLCQTHTSINYCETHTGYPFYDLTSSPEWQQGIGAFRKACIYQEKPHADVQFFYDLIDGDNLTVHHHYSGSSKLVERCIQQNKIQNFQLHLCENHHPVFDALKSTYDKDPHVYLYFENGYATAKALTDMDLYFVDPPNIDDQYDDYVEIIRYLTDRHAPLVSWNALRGNSAGDGPIEACQAIQSLANKWGLQLLTIKWKPEYSQAMCGCQMLISSPLAVNIPPKVLSLCHLMDWELI